MNDNVTSNLQKMGQALQFAGTDQCYYYPGMKGSALANAVVPGAKSSLNERNAFEFGYGSSIAGGRSVVIFKGVGLATCLDSVHHAVINGVGAGLVVILLEDTIAASSPEIIDSRVMLDYARTLLIEPNSIESALTLLQTSFGVSEQLNTPVFFRLTHELLASDAPNDAPAQVPATAAPEIEFSEYRKSSIGSWAERVIPYEKKQAAIQAYVDSIYASVADKVGSVAFGAAPNGEGSTVVEHYPIATKLRQSFAKYTPEVHEIGSNYAKRSLLSGPITLDSSKTMFAEMPVMRDWEPVLSKVDKTMYKIVVADEGRYTSDSTGIVDLCLCMGSSIAITAGASKQTDSRNLAIIGDFAYLFNAYPSIIEAAAHGVKMDIILLDDGKASSTGGQDAIAPIRIEDIRSYVSEAAEYNFKDLPAQLIQNKDAAGIRIYRIKKDE